MPFIDSRGRRRNLSFGRPRKPDSDYKSAYRKIDGVPAHRWIVEERTGIRLPATAQVHHVDPTDKLTNKGLFVVCQDAAYHRLLEMRTAALKACGNPSWRKCEKCKQWDSPDNLRIYERNYRGKNEVRSLHRRKNNWCVDANGQPVAEVAPQARCSPEYAAVLRERRRSQSTG